MLKWPVVLEPLQNVSFAARENKCQTWGLWDQQGKGVKEASGCYAFPNQLVNVYLLDSSYQIRHLIWGVPQWLSFGTHPVPSCDEAWITCDLRFWLETWELFLLHVSFQWFIWLHPSEVNLTCHSPESPGACPLLILGSPVFLNCCSKDSFLFSFPTNIFWWILEFPSPPFSLSVVRMPLLWVKIIFTRKY